MKLSRIYIIATAILIAGIIVFLVGFSMLDFKFSNFDTEPVYTPVKYSADGKTPGIIIKDSDADLRFNLSSDNKIHVKYYENGIRGYEITTLDDGTLSIALKVSSDWTQKLHISRSTPIVTVSLPKKYAGDIRAECENGSIDLSGIVADSITATADGSIRIVGCTVKNNLSLSANGGNLELYNNTAGGAAQLNAYKGNILAQLITSGELYTNASGGYMTLADVSSKGNIFGECKGGDIRLSALNAKKDITLIAENGDIRGGISGDAAEFNYNCSASSGSCNLPLSQFGGVRGLNLRAQNGDIEVQIAAQ